MLDAPRCKDLEEKMSTLRAVKEECEGKANRIEEQSLRIQNLEAVIRNGNGVSGDGGAEGAGGAGGAEGAEGDVSVLQVQLSQQLTANERLQSRVAELEEATERLRASAEQYKSQSSGNSGGNGDSGNSGNSGSGVSGDSGSAVAKALADALAEVAALALERAAHTAAYEKLALTAYEQLAAAGVTISTLQVGVICMLYYNRRR
jgi:DNA repair exonuclease SbcCD ATPase subunit